MAASNGDLANHLIDGGLSPQAARLIANALANAGSPQFSQGLDATDATPRDALRLIDGDSRRYRFTNLDYGATAPFRDRLDSHANRYSPQATEHPYKDSQPIKSASPLSSPRVQAGDYMAVDNGVDGDAAVSKVRLKLRVEPGRHLRLDPSTKSLEGVPLIARTQGRFLSADFVETDDGTELVISLRGTEEQTVVLENADSRKAMVFPTAGATGPAGLAAGGTRSLEKVTVRLETGAPQEILVWKNGSAGTALPVCKAMVVFDATRNSAGTAVDSASPAYPVGDVFLIKAINVTSVRNLVQGNNGNGNARYKINLASGVFADGNYCVVGTAGADGNNIRTVIVRTDAQVSPAYGAPSASDFTIQVLNGSSDGNAPLRCSVAVFA